MLFSFTKAVFATLAFGAAAVSAIPTPVPANAVAMRGGEDVLTLLADVKADIDVDLGKLSMFDVFTPIDGRLFIYLSVVSLQMPLSPLK